ncbi:MAG: ATP-binding protein [Acidobacteria bacterium]|nr:ATP-binding protein [Acidobacteriota bacterium]
MRGDSKLIGKLYEITRGDLEAATFPPPQLGRVLDRMSFVRLSRVSRFWQRADDNDPVPLEHAAEDFVTGLHGQACPWLFLICGSPRGLECWFGAALSKLDRESLRLAVNSAFPDSRFGEAASPDKSHLESLRHALVVTGTPSARSVTERESGGQQIERLCRGMAGANWAYAVYAEPVGAAEVVATLNEVAAQVQDAYATYLLKASAADEHNRTAQRYVELLEAKLKRLERGRSMGMWAAHVMLLTDGAASLGRGQTLIHGAFSGEASVPDPVRVRPCAAGARESPPLEPLNSTELAVLTRPPREDYPGYEVVGYSRFGVEAGRAGEDAVTVGEVVDRGRRTGNVFGIPRRDLTKHGLVVGVTGSGKTNTCFELLDQVWDGGRGVPFTVIESAKSEYRSLLKSHRFKGLRVFTVGDETTSPLRLNPFEVPGGVLVQTHIDYLKSLFSAAFVLYPPMPYVLEQSLQEVYEDRGWDLVENRNGRGADSPRAFPTLSDLAAKVEVVVERMGYDDRLTMDIKAGLLARINQLRLGGGKGPMLDVRHSHGTSVLWESPCLLELKQVVSDDEKAFIIGLLIINLYEYYEARPHLARGELRHVTLIEEAHRLLRNVSTEQGGEVAANPKGKAIEVFANILSEIRAYGEGILIAEQIPTKLAPDAVKNTNLKIVHRLVSEDDRRLLGSTINLSQSQSAYLATLRAGEAVAYAEGLQKPVLLSVPLARAKPAAGNMPAAEVREAMSPFLRRRNGLDGARARCAMCERNGAASHHGGGSFRRTGPALSSSFVRLFNALRCNKALVVAAYTDFRASCRRESSVPKREGAEYCLFVDLLEAEVERRGEHAAWTHEDVGRAIELASAVAFNLSNNLGRETVKETERGHSKELLAFSALCKRLHKEPSPPYAGCRSCAEPCYYRFDMSRGGRKHVGEFREAFYDPRVGKDELARICWDASAERFLAGDLRARRGASLCFAAQRLADLGLSDALQEEVSRELTRSFERL